MAVEYVGSGNDDGVVFGRSSTDKIGFYGLATPIVKPSITVVTTANKTTALNEVSINRIHAALSALGLVTLA